MYFKDHFPRTQLVALLSAKIFLYKKKKKKKVVFVFSHRGNFSLSCQFTLDMHTSHDGGCIHEFSHSSRERQTLCIMDVASLPLSACLSLSRHLPLSVSLSLSQVCVVLLIWGTRAS